MADNYETMNQESPNYGCFKEAVCIDASRVYDSCGDKDCLEDLRVYFSPASQAVIDQAAQVRMRNVDVLVVYLGLEPVPFHKGFYSVDMTFFFEVTLDVFQTPAAPPVTISGLSVFSKNVVLYGSEGNVKVFSSDGSLDELEQNSVQSLPKASAAGGSVRQALRRKNLLLRALLQNSRLHLQTVRRKLLYGKYR